MAPTMIVMLAACRSAGGGGGCQRGVLEAFMCLGAVGFVLGVTRSACGA